MDDPPPPRTNRLQFSVAGLLITTTLVALFCGLLSIGSFELAMLEVFVLSLLLMVFGAQRGREHPSWVVGCLVAGAVHAALNFGLLVSTLAIDAFAIFSSGYFLFCLGASPPILRWNHAADGHRPTTTALDQCARLRTLGSFRRDGPLLVDCRYSGRVCEQALLATLPLPS